MVNHSLLELRHKTTYVISQGNTHREISQPHIGDPCTPAKGVDLRLVIMHFEENSTTLLEDRVPQGTYDDPHEEPQILPALDDVMNCSENILQH